MIRAMKTLSGMIVTLGLVVLASMLVVSCGSKGGGANAKAFDSAKPEVKTLWEKAQTAAKAKDYAAALLTFQQLSLRTDLTPEQVKAVEVASTAVSDQMYEAANKGDAEATKAVETLRKARYR